jgi:hypothetical protein
VEPNLAPKAYEKYETFSRLHIIPHLGSKRLDNIQVKEIRQWLNKIATVCQCCAQEKTRRGRSTKGAAAQSGNAAGQRCPHEAVKTLATRFALRLPAR